MNYDPSAATPGLGALPAFGMGLLAFLGLACSIGLSLFWLAQAGLAVTSESLKIAVVLWAISSVLSCAAILFMAIRRRRFRMLFLFAAAPFILVNAAIPLVLRLGQ